MREVAAATGVHQTTVSLALRNHPSIPPATRERIRAAALTLGYRPDPLLHAFNFHRVTSHPVKGAPTLAMIFDARMLPRSHEHDYPRRLCEAARSTATERGYRLEVFVLEEAGLHPARLARVLAARGITGVILSNLSPDTEPLELDWPRLCAVKIESRHVRPALDAISSDQWQTTRRALRRLRELGYRRVGLVVSREDEERLGEPFRTGMLVEQQSLPARERVPTLMFEARGERAALGGKIDAWVRRHRVDAVLSNWNNVLMEVRAQGWRVPDDLAVASLDLPQASGELAGILQNHRLVGRQAVEQVTMLLQSHRLGIPPIASVSFVPGRWQDGASAPAR